MDRAGSVPRRSRSLFLLFPKLLLSSASNGLSAERASPITEFIIVVSNVAALQCFEWTEWGACRADYRVYYCCFQCCSFAVFRIDRVGSMSRRLRSLLLLFPMLQLHSVSNGPSGEAATPIAESRDNNRGVGHVTTEED